MLRKTSWQLVILGMKIALPMVFTTRSLTTEVISMETTTSADPR